MLHRNIANRYAKALFVEALEKKQLEAVEADFPRVVDLIENTPGLNSFITHPAIISSEKKKVISGMLAGKVNDLLFDFLCLIVDKRRESYIPLVWEGYRDLLLEHRKSEEAVIQTPYELPADIVGALSAKLEQVTGKTIIIKQQIEPGLIGGVRVRIGDRVVDGSIIHRMDMMKQALESARV